jgi:hypothetical protein
LNGKLKAQAEQFLLEWQNGFQNGVSCIKPLFSMKLLLEKRRELNLETPLAFLDCVKAFDKVIGGKLFEILQSKNIPNLLLKSIIETYFGNKIKVKIDNQLSQEHTINYGVRQERPLSPKSFNIYMNEITVKWNQIYTHGITLSTTTKINTVLFADIQVIIADSVDNLQRGIITLQNKAKTFGMEISPEKTKTVTFLGQDPVRCKSYCITDVYSKLRIVNISVVKFPMKMKKVSYKN